MSHWGILNKDLMDWDVCFGEIAIVKKWSCLPTAGDVVSSLSGFRAVWLYRGSFRGSCSKPLWTKCSSLMPFQKRGVLWAKSFKIPQLPARPWKSGCRQSSCPYWKPGSALTSPLSLHGARCFQTLLRLIGRMKPSGCQLREPVLIFYGRGWQTFRKYFMLWGPHSLVATIQLSCYRQNVNEWMWLCSNKTPVTKQAMGQMSPSRPLVQWESAVSAIFTRSMFALRCPFTLNTLHVRDRILVE